MILDKVTHFLWKSKPEFWTYSMICVLGLSGPKLVFRPQIPSWGSFSRFLNFTGFISWFMKKWESCLWKVELHFWTNSWIRLPGPSGPNVVSRSQAPRSINFLRFKIIYQIYLTILEKMSSWLWILEPGF